MKNDELIQNMMNDIENQWRLQVKIYVMEDFEKMIEILLIYKSINDI